MRLPGPLVAEIEAESRERNVTKSDIVRERLQQPKRRARPAALAAIADLVGSVDGLPTDLSASRKRYLKSTGYGRNRHR